MCKRHYDTGRVESRNIFASMIIRVVEAIIPLYITYSPRMQMKIIISHRLFQDKSMNVKERELKTYVMSPLIVSDKCHLRILRFNMHPFQRLLHLVIRAHAMCFPQCTYIFLVPPLIRPILAEESIRLRNGRNIDLSKRSVNTDETRGLCTENISP